MKASLFLALLALAGCQAPAPYHTVTTVQATPEITRQQMHGTKGDIDSAKQGVTFGGKRP